MQERSSKVIAIVALCVGVVGLSLGFAAFSAQLTVNSGATVSVDEATEFDAVIGYVKGQALESGELQDATEAYPKSWTGITYDFKNSSLGETKTYTATVKNDSAFTAYLANVSAPSVATCEAVADAEGNTISANYKDLACGQIKVAVDAPESIPAGGSDTVTVTITGPSTVVDGALAVAFSPVTIDYTTAAPVGE